MTSLQLIYFTHAPAALIDTSRPLPLLQLPCFHLPYLTLLNNRLPLVHWVHYLVTEEREGILSTSPAYLLQISLSEYSSLKTALQKAFKKHSQIHAGLFPLID